ncbi:hypothetical protein [Shewanella sp. 10N.286.48.A6]|uniref:hypothetical protein n=1 Tax=Shewanella sp. 10N.286.48.A6 TaxID=1880833 RepID=UPI0039A75BF1
MFTACYYSSENGVDQNILGMAKIQDAVWMHPCGLELSKAYEAASAERKKSVCLSGQVLN